MVAMRGAPVEVSFPDTAEPRPPLEGEALAALELACLVTSRVYLGVGVPRGNGRSVLVLPGFLGNDDYLLPLRGWLTRIGYAPRASGVVFNFGTPSSLLAGVLRRAEYIAAHNPGRMLVIGHSLGGVFARALAVMRPDLVAHAITLGAPLTRNARAAAHPMVANLSDLLLSEANGSHAVDVLADTVLGVALPAGVRLTSLYSRRDAVVDWRACVDTDPQADSIEVHGTHTGLPWNAEVYHQLGLLLASTAL